MFDDNGLAGYLCADLAQVAALSLISLTCSLLLNKCSLGLLVLFVEHHQLPGVPVDH